MVKRSLVALIQRQGSNVKAQGRNTGQIADLEGARKTEGVDSQSFDTCWLRDDTSFYLFKNDSVPRVYKAEVSNNQNSHFLASVSEKKRMLRSWVS